MAAFGGIMGLDGRRQYGIGSYFQKLKDKIVGTVKDNPELTAALVLGGADLSRGEDSALREIFSGFEIPKVIRDAGTAAKEFIFDKPTKPNPNFDPNKPEGPNNPRMIEGTSIAGNIGRSLAENIVPIAGGITAGLFTKNQPEEPGLPDDTTALQLAELKKSANLLDQKQGLAANLNFLPAVAARQFTPEEMAITYAQSAANGGRIGRAEGGLMDLGGLEKDYRAEGGFVPIGKREKADDVPARLSVNEFVFTADAVRNAGGGDVDEGAKVMERVMKHLEAGGKMSRESQGMSGARDMFAVSERLSEVV